MFIWFAPGYFECVRATHLRHIRHWLTRSYILIYCNVSWMSALCGILCFSVCHCWPLLAWAIIRERARTVITLFGSFIPVGNFHIFTVYFWNLALISTGSMLYACAHTVAFFLFCVCLVLSKIMKLYSCWETIFLRTNFLKLECLRSSLSQI